MQSKLKYFTEVIRVEQSNAHVQLVGDIMENWEIHRQMLRVENPHSMMSDTDRVFLKCFLRFRPKEAYTHLISDEVLAPEVSELLNLRFRDLIAELW